MRINLLLALPLCALCVLCENPSRAADPPAGGGVVSHIKVLSDKVEDVSSLEAWQKSFLKPNLNDSQKALAIWSSTVKFRHHDTSPREFLTKDPAVYDAIKTFNVYGYCTGATAQPAFLALARYAGFQARHLSIYRFGVPELYYDNAWHMYDVGMINYFPKPDGSVAGVDDIVSAVKAWHAQHPGYHDNGPKLKDFLKDPAGGIKSGPPLLLTCPTLQPNGSYTFNSFGWASTMIIYDTEKPPFIYEEPYSQGYQVNNQLRPGEKLTFNWSNKGLHVNMLDEPRKDPDCLTAIVGQKQLAYTPALGDLANNRIGNGTLEYTPPIDSLKDSALTCDNLAASDHALHPSDPAQPASLILDMPCSYVYLAGTLILTANISPHDSIRIEISDNNGLDWKPLALVTTPNPAPIDLQKFIFRRYDYRLKFTLIGAGITSLHLTHDFQHSQRALPALAQGDNTISFSAGPNEGTLTIEPAPPKHKDRQLTAQDFHVALNHITQDDNGIFTPDGPADQDANITCPITTPGDLTRLRFGCHYRAQGTIDRTGWLFQVSFDDGKTFLTVHRTQGSARADADWITFDKIPPHTRHALVRFQAVGRDNLFLDHSRIDADYTYPNTPSTAFAPVQVTYTWTASDQEQSHTHLARTPTDIWQINCPTKPTLKSLTLQLAP